ncbi:MAG: hypothetical protein Ta2E_11130 [Mycoplasmoidaceae bacterium]|nr:MAG: hypothetical protein Ta2E_11130 [Mycoplasmoidaceae bacterium]
MKLNNTSHFFLKDEESKEFVYWLMDEEMKSRKVEVDEKEQIFFNWKEAEGGKTKGKLHSLIS